MSTLPQLSLLCVDFFQQSVCVPPLVHEIKDVADIYTDASCQSLVEVDVGAEAVPVAVEGETDQLSLAIEHGAAGVAARDVVVGEEAELHLSAGLVLVLAEILF